MDPDRNKSGMTVNALMQTGLIASIAISVVCIALLGFVGLAGLGGTFLLIVLACAIVVVLGIIIANYMVQRKIKDRLLSLVDVCRDYAGGDRTVRAAINGDDEFAMLAMSLNTLLDTQGGSGGGVSMNTNGSDAAVLQAQIEKLLQEVSAVGDGDLRVQAEVTPDTLGVLADSFNYMIEELAKVVGRVQSTAVQVTNATRRILDRSAELALASETQVAQISQTTEAVEALAIFIQNVARNAQASVEVAQEALRNATSGQQSVRQTIEGMMLIRENVQETSKKIKRLGERSNEIGEIVRIIEDIADQTNLLALNAAIQSAMAGEHGRGFAVVADEIRLLAERSTESTKKIATLVKSIQGDTYEAVVAMEDSTQEVVKGSQLADEAGRALNSIYGAVERQAQMIESIARSANEQTTVSEAVAVTMSQISEITRQTDAGTQDAAVSVSYLADLAEQLRSSVSTFRLPDRANEVSGPFSSMTSISEFSEGGEGNLLAPPMSAGMEHDWNRGFSGGFPPLPEPGNSGSLVALTSRSGQYAFSNQQELNNQLGFGALPPSNGQQGFGGQPYYQNQQGYGNTNGSQQFGNQQGFGGNGQQFPSGNQQSYGGQQYGNQQGYNGSNGNQQGFADQQSFANQQAYNSSQYGGQQDFGNMGGMDGMDGNGMGGFDNQQDFYGNGQQQFDMMSGFGGQGQPFQQNQTPTPLPSQQGQPSSPQVRQRRPGGPQQSNPGQAPYNQDRFPFQNNG